jgi:hypothetical protein
MTLRWCFVGLLSAACVHGRPSTRVAAANMVVAGQAGPADVPGAVRRALVFLERDGTDWMDGKNPLQGGKGCVSCHHVGFALWSHREAQRAGVPVPEERMRALEAKARAFVAATSEDAVMQWTEVMLGGGGHEWPAFHGKVKAGQEKNGTWKAAGQFPSQRRPIAESDAVATIWTLLADGRAGPHRDRALASLAAAPAGTSNEWLLTRALLEQRMGRGAAAERLLQTLLGQQRPDGGWSFLPGQASNALSTGETLYALRVAGRPPTDPALRAGVGYLLRTQAADGTWAVPAAAFSTKASESRQYIYRYWGTAWATIGLARAGITEIVASGPR